MATPSHPELTTTEEQAEAGVLVPVARSSRFRKHPLLWFVVRRCLAGLGLAVLVSLLAFAATNILPGDVASAALGRTATPEAKADLRAELGLDRPLYEQYWDWISGVAQGDLGTSLAARRPVSEVLGDRFRNTAILALVSIVVIVPLAFVLGVLAAIKAQRWPDLTISGLTLAVIAIPEFVIGTVLVLIFAVNRGWFPSVSLVAPGESPLDTPEVLVLPVATLLLAGLAYMLRMVRASMVEVMGSDYVEMARLNGVPEGRVVTRFALRNALAPTVQAIALTLQWLVGGVVIIEVLFAYPGIGEALVQSVTARDGPLIQSVALIIALFYILVNVVADVIIVLLIPKLRTAQ